MIEFNNMQIKFSNMGYFISENDWIHPTRIIDTYEIIFVIDGEIFIREDQTKYTLSRGDFLLLKPHVQHSGYKKSNGVRFFWLHFYAENFNILNQSLYHIKDFTKYELLFKKLNHDASIKTDNTIIECELALMLLNQNNVSYNKCNKIFHEVEEYIRINVQNGLSVSSIAKKFGYNPDHLSKIFTKNASISLKKYIDIQRNNYVKNLLANTNMSLKEIAFSAGFSDDSALIKFFRYNNDKTPTEFRNLYYATHINNN